MADVRIEDLQLWLNSEITGNEKLPTSGKKAVTIAQIVNRMANVLDGKDIVIISARSGDYVATVQGWKAAVNAEFGTLHVRGQAAVGSLLSHDFVTGISGFKAGSDGNAEFKNLKVRQGITATEISSTNFVSGALGSGFKFGADGSIEAESLSLRTGLTVPELVVKKITGQGGSIAVTDTMKITEVVGNVCKFDTAGGTIFNPFAVGDLLRCQRWDNGIKYYTAQVTAIDVDSFTVIVIHGGDAPAAGDEVFKFGNVSDTARQSLIYLTNSDTGAPYMDVLDGVNSADLSGKTKVRLGKLSGITDAHFGALEGYGLYANNAYLRDANVKGKIEMTDASGNIIFSATQNLAGARIQNIEAHKIQVGGASIMTDATGAGKIKADYLQVTKSLVVGAVNNTTYSSPFGVTGAYSVGDKIIQSGATQWRDGKEFVTGKTYVAKATRSIFNAVDWDLEPAKIYRGDNTSLPDYYKIGDLFIPSSTFSYGAYEFVANVTYQATSSATSAFVASHWQALSVQDAAAALAAATAAQTAASNAQSTANTANTNASNAQSTANTANTNASNAQTAATNAQNAANAAAAAAAAAQTDITNLENQQASLDAALIDVQQKTNGRTYIGPGVVETGVVLVGNGSTATAGLSGVIDAGTASIIMFSGAGYDNKNVAPFRVRYDGGVIAANGTVEMLPNGTGVIGKGAVNAISWNGSGETTIAGMKVTGNGFEKPSAGGTSAYKVIRINTTNGQIESYEQEPQTGADDSITRRFMKYENGQGLTVYDDGNWTDKRNVKLSAFRYKYSSWGTWEKVFASNPGDEVDTALMIDRGNMYMANVPTLQNYSGTGATHYGNYTGVSPYANNEPMRRGFVRFAPVKDINNNTVVALVLDGQDIGAGVGTIKL